MYWPGAGTTLLLLGMVGGSGSSQATGLSRSYGDGFSLNKLAAYWYHFGKNAPVYTQFAQANFCYLAIVGTGVYWTFVVSHRILSNAHVDISWDVSGLFFFFLNK